MATARASAVRFEERASVELNPLIGVCWISLDSDEQMYFIDRTADGAEFTKQSSRETHVCRVAGPSTTCTCKGWKYNGRCRHAAALAHLIRANLI